MIFLFTVTLQGNASGGERARYVGNHANELINFAMDFIAQKSVLPEYPPSGNLIIEKYIWNWGHQYFYTTYFALYMNFVRNGNDGYALQCLFLF